MRIKRKVIAFTTRFPAAEYNRIRELADAYGLSLQVMQRRMIRVADACIASNGQPSHSLRQLIDELIHAQGMAAARAEARGIIARALKAKPQSLAGSGSKANLRPVPIGVDAVPARKGAK